MTPPATMDQLRDGSMNLPASTKCVIGASSITRSTTAVPTRRAVQIGSRDVVLKENTCERQGSKKVHGLTYYAAWMAEARIADGKSTPFA